MTAPLPARRLLGGFRDLGVGDDEDRRSKLACDPSFNRYTAYWLLGETLDAAYAAFEGIFLISPAEADALVTESEGRITGFLEQHHDPASGCFIADSSERTRGISAFHAAVGLARGLAKIQPGKPLTSKALGGLVLGTEGGGRKLLDAAESLVADARCGDGVLENPARPLIPTLTTLYTAASVLWNLSPTRSRGIYRLVPPERLERFVAGCIKRQRVAERLVAGFSVHPDHWELCVNTTCFGLRLMKRLGLPLDGDLRRSIESFLTLSYRDGGFSSTLWEPRSLNATFFGLRAFRLLGAAQSRRFVAKHRRDILSFVRSCWNPKTGGAPFSPDWTRYRENCLATRYWLQILEHIEAPLDPREAAETLRFFKSTYDPRSGGFRGYAADQVDTEGFGLRELERYLDGKDRSFRREHRRKLEDPGRPVSPSPGTRYFPDTRLVALYDRLADLERHKEEARDAGAVEEEIEETWRELRSRQESEADRLEDYFMRNVVSQLDQGFERIRRAEELLARDEAPPGEN